MPASIKKSMTPEANVSGDYVKKKTMFIIAGICLAFGFFSGIAVTIYKTMPQTPTLGAGMGQETEAERKVDSRVLEQIKALEDEVAEKPKNVEAWIELGNRYFDSDQPEKAIQAYEKSLAINPENADVITDMGIMHRRMGKPKLAVETFDRAMGVNPRHETSRFNKGIVLLHDLNDTEGAIRAWEELVKLNPDYTTPTGQKIKDMVNMYRSRAKTDAEKPSEKKPSL
ncbi:MAG: tetratricopeptide repeat protein [Thermodesulfobacteriota bacterium]